MNSGQAPVIVPAKSALVEKVRLGKSKMIKLKGAHEQVQGISFASDEWKGNRFRVRLYRFLAESIPLISSVIWTWSRLAAAPGQFQFYRKNRSIDSPQARMALDDLFNRINRNCFGHIGPEADLMAPLFQSLFLDGAILGKMELFPDLSGIADYRFFDLAALEMKISSKGEVTASVAHEDKENFYSGPTLFFYALNADLSNPYGRSILKSVPFVSFVEQQLVDDMRRTTHNAGYHRLHVRIKPPEKNESETDEAYATRANNYFDNTVAMIRDIEPEDNPVTWDDVAVEYIGPNNAGGARTANWYLTHRAMVEEICSGTNLAPFMLGYSYNATTNWAQLKYDLVMRQVRSVQNAAISFLNWLANVELSMRGFDFVARWQFDNNFSSLAKDDVEVKGKEAARIIDLYKAGLIDQEAASQAAAGLV